MQKNVGRQIRNLKNINIDFPLNSKTKLVMDVPRLNIVISSSWKIHRSY